MRQRVRWRWGRLGERGRNAGSGKVEESIPSKAFERRRRK